MKRLTIFLGALLMGGLLVAPLLAQEQNQRGPGRGFRGGRGPAAGQGFGRGPGAGEHRRGGGRHGGHDPRHNADRAVFQFLLQHHQEIERTVKDLPNGVETLTESENAEVADKIKEHVEWMADRIEKRNPIRMRDPLFAEIFKHAEKITIEHEETEQGVRVTETSDDPYVARLIQAHARVVSGFVEKGFAEAFKNHPVPRADAAPPAAAPPVPAGKPAIEGHGAVIRLPQAAHQPRPGSKILVDITAGADADQQNAAIEKVAKYLNLYAAGGAEPAAVQIAVVFHGDATLDVLHHEAYARHFQTAENPNLDLLHRLHEAGVEMFVCGQSLVSQDGSAEEVAIFVEPAVSALTAVVNLQAEGYAYVPLAK